MADNDAAVVDGGEVMVKMMEIVMLEELVVVAMALTLAAIVTVLLDPPD